LLHEPKQNIAAVVDPAEAEPVLQKLQELEAELFLNTTIIMTCGKAAATTVWACQSLWRRKGSGRIPGIQVFFARRIH